MLRRGFTLIELMIVAAIVCILGFLILGALDAEAQEVQEGVVGTFTVAPGAVVVSPNPAVNPFRPNTVVGPVVTFPRTDGLPVDWATLRANRLAEIAAAAEGQLFFGFDSSELEKGSDEGLATLAQLLADNPDVGVQLAGHTDLVGDDAYNVALGVRRAEAVRNGLLRLGVESKRVRVSSYGESAPVSLVPGADAANRRVEISTFDLFVIE